MTEARLHEIEQLKRDELMRGAHEIVPELCEEIRRYYELAKMIGEIAEFEYWHLFPPDESCAKNKYCRCVEKGRVAKLLKELNDQ